MLVSQATLVEYNVVILIIGIVLSINVYNHTALKWEITYTLNMTNTYAFSTERYICLTRVVIIITHTANTIFGIFAAKLESVHLAPIYIIIMSLLMAYNFSIVMSVIIYPKPFMYKIEVLINRLWLEDGMANMEKYFDCCGRNGVHDYTIVGRMPSASSCCRLDNCYGCSGILYSFMWELEKEGARDCTILFVMQFLAIVLIVIFLIGLPPPIDRHEDMEMKTT